MAQIHRERNELLALELSLQPSRSGSRVTIRFFRGHDEVDEPLSLPAEAFGIPAQLRFSEVRENEPLLFPDAREVPPGLDVLAARVSAVTKGLPPTEALWLQISQGSNYLVTVPWESIIRTMTRPDLPILRIPNFLIDPQFGGPGAKIALCASSPSAKGPYDTVAVVDQIIDVLADLDIDLDAHLFLDLEAWATMEGLEQRGKVQITLHHPAGAEQYGYGATALQDRAGGLSSPWLQWMDAELGPRRTDLVHFISPGYFTADLGGLALAHSPLGDIGRRMAHFVSATEMNQFLNGVGAWAVACTIPIPDPWSIGVRIFAEQLARKRPEPIIVHHGVGWEPGTEKYSGLAAGYRYLFRQQTDLPPSPSTALYLHPKRLGALADPEAVIASSNQSEFAFELETSPPEEFAAILKKSDPVRVRRVSGESKWQASVRLDVEQSFSQLATSGIVTPEQEGKADALRFLIDALEASEEPE